MPLGRFYDDYDGEDGRGSSPIAQAMTEVAQAQAQVSDDGTALDVLLAQVREHLTSRHVLNAAQMENPTAAELTQVRQVVNEIVKEYVHTATANGLPPLTIEPEEAVERILGEIFGFGPIEPYMHDPTVEEIAINGPNRIFVTSAGKGKRRVPARFRSAEQLFNFVNAMAAASGRKIDRQNPEINVKMRDGSRLHAIMEPLVDNAFMAVTIRRHRTVVKSLDDLVRTGAITPALATFLRWAVKGKLNIIVSGGTAAGKTTLLNVLTTEIPIGERIITVEDTPELHLPVHEAEGCEDGDVIHLLTRPPTSDIEEIGLDRLVRSCLRMRPDRIITGEARGPEIVDVLTAANTGHRGQMLTVHANSVQHAVQRLETMYHMAGKRVESKAIREQIVSGFDLLIHLRHEQVGEQGFRFVSGVAELTGRMEEETVEVALLFEDKGEGLVWTGQWPVCLEKMGRTREEFRRHVIEAPPPPGLQGMAMVKAAQAGKRVLSPARSVVEPGKSGEDGDGVEDDWEHTYYKYLWEDDQSVQGEDHGSGNAYTTG